MIDRQHHVRKRLQALPGQAGAKRCFAKPRPACRGSRQTSWLTRPRTKIVLCSCRIAGTEKDASASFFFCAGTAERAWEKTPDSDLHRNDIRWVISGSPVDASSQLRVTPAQARIQRLSPHLPGRGSIVTMHVSPGMPDNEKLPDLPRIARGSARREQIRDLYPP